MAIQITSSFLVIKLDYNTCLLPFLFIHMPNRLKDSKIINIKPAKQKRKEKRLSYEVENVSS